LFHIFSNGSFLILNGERLLPYSGVLLQELPRNFFLELVHSVMGDFGPVCRLLLQLDHERPLSSAFDEAVLINNLVEVLNEVTVDVSVAGKPFEVVVPKDELGIDPLAVDLKRVGVLHTDVEALLAGIELKGDCELPLLLCDKHRGWALLFTHKKDILNKENSFGLMLVAKNHGKKVLSKIMEMDEV
jgi:hypothetical protein